MDLYLIRHAIAEARDAERWPDDSQRPLSADGRELFRHAARGLCRLGAGVEAVLTSSYVRASETAAILTEVADWPEAELCRALEPPAAAAESVQMLDGRTESVLALVGHQPELAELISVLLTASEHALELELKKGAVVSLRFRDRPAAGGGVLRWSASPKILRQLDR